MAFASETEVPVERTKNQIEHLVVVKHGAVKYMTGQQSAPPRAMVQFEMKDRIVRFELPLPLKAKDERRLAQLHRSRWRALLLIVKAKLEAVESGVTTFEEEFLAHIVLPGDKTVGQSIIPMIANAYASSRTPRLLAEFATPEVVDAE